MVDHVVGNSRYTLNEHLKRGYFKQANKDVIFNIADVKQLATRPIHKDAQEEIAFGFLGRVEDEKGIHILLQACQLLPKTGWHLYVAGNGRDDYVAGLKEKHKTLPVTWLGFVDTNTLFAKIDVLVVPSVWPEPLPRTIIEAAARGIPVLASDAGGQPELMNLGLYGLLYPALSVTTLAGYMQDIMDGKSALVATTESMANDSWGNLFSADEVTARNLATYRG
jgi:glycosyltransferase involved in cell wall biosynthesis